MTRDGGKPAAWRVVALLMLMIPLIAARGGPVAGAQDAPAPLRIGALFPFTGDLADFGPAFLQAAELAVDEINASGGVNGAPIELVQGDTATSPQQAVAEAHRLIDIEGVSAIIGPAGSGETLPVVESVAGPDEMLVISPSATSPALTVANDGDFFFRTTISDGAQGVVIADLARELGYRSACVLYINNAYGQGLNDVFADRFAAVGGTVTAQVPHEQEQASYAAELASCTADGPAAIAAISHPESAGIFLRELVESGDAPAILLSDGLKSADLFAELGWEHFEGAFGTAPGARESATGEAFRSGFEAAYGDLPSLPYLKEIYDAVYLTALAAELADASEPAAIRDALREVANDPGEAVGPGTAGWQAAVALIDGGQGVNYEGASGPIEFDQNGDIMKGTILVWKIERGAIVNIEARDIDLQAGTAAQVVTAPYSGLQISCSMQAADRA